MSSRIEMTIRFDEGNLEQVKDFLGGLPSGEILKERVVVVSETRDDIDTQILDIDWDKEVEELKLLVGGVIYAVSQSNSDSQDAFFALERKVKNIDQFKLHNHHLTDEMKKEFKDHVINEFKRSITKYSGFQTRPLEVYRSSPGSIRYYRYQQKPMSTCLTPSELRCLIMMTNLDGLGMADTSQLNKRENLSQGNKKILSYAARSLFEGGIHKLDRSFNGYTLRSDREGYMQ